MQGTIKRLVTEKGFGFIADSQTSVQYFFHRSALERGEWGDLEEGMAVTFETEKSEKGPRATQVRTLGR